MAFSFGNNGQSPFGAAQQAQGPSVQSQTGPDLEDIQTEALGFLSLAGESKLQLLPTPWPSNELPPPTSSLMSIASQKGIVAAAGPDVVVIASTDSIRKGFEAPKSNESEIRPFQSPLAIPMSMRVSQVVFTSDESLLVLSAENGGGLAVHEVQKLLNGDTQRAFEMPTNSVSVRALVPNPTPEKAELLAVVTTDGNLMMANLKERTFLSGPISQVLKEGVSCVSWSARGKQLVAGLGDGTAYQMTPEGDKKADIPRPPSVDSNHHVSSITWLENNVFLMIHTPSNFDVNSAPPSTFHIVTRHSPTEFMFQKIPDPAEPFGLNRSPPHHFLLRLREFPPSLQDVLVVASTASTDIGLLTRSRTPLVADKPADKVTGVFTMTGMSDDSRRAILPVSPEEMSDTSPIGLVLDLSSQMRVRKPIPKDEMDNSSTPVPGVMALNNEGVLAYWWIIYTDSILQGTVYPGLVAAGTSSVQPTSQPLIIQQGSTFGVTAPQATFAQPAFGTTTTPSSGFSSFNKSVTPAFGTTSASGGSPSTAFGAASGLNKAPSPWGTPAGSSTSNPGSAFGTPAFGSAPAAGTNLAFGSAALPGNRASPWGTGSTKPVGSAFGQPSGLGMAVKPATFGSTPSGGVFGEGGNATPTTSGGFASFANTAGFAAATSKSNTSGNIFGSKPTGGPFAAPASSSGLGTAATTSFAGPTITATDKPQGLFGGDAFKLGSTFKPDGSAKDDGPKPSNIGSSFFGSGFGSALGEVQKAPISTPPDVLEADMEDEEPASVLGPKDESQSATKASFSKILEAPNAPAAIPEPPKAPSISGGLFGSSTTAKSLFPSTVSNPTGFSFGNQSASLARAPESTPIVKPVATTEAPATPEASKIKQEPQSDDEVKSNLLKIPEPPLPPDITSKNSYTIGDSSVSSIEPDAPSASKPTAPTSFNQVNRQEKSTVTSSKEFPPQLESQSPVGSPVGQEEEADNSEDYVTEDEGDQSGSQSESQSGAESENEEGSGEDVTKDFSLASGSGSNVTPGFTPQSSFGGVAKTSTGEGLFANLSRPQPGKTARGLFGEIHGKSTPMLPPPKDLSPRSPSPVRTTIPGRLLRGDTARSVSAPGVASQLLGPPKPASSRPIPSSSRSIALGADQRKNDEQHIADLKAKKEAEESQALIDEEDERIQLFLRQDVVGTTRLDDFIAHQDYVSSENRDGIPSQVEALYRDINSMIDTLGMNSLALKSFIKGHCEGQVTYTRTRDDLDGENEWCLSEIEILSRIVEHDLTDELERGRIQDLAGKLEACTILERELGKLRAKHDDIKTLAMSQSDPNHLALLRSKPLSAEQATQQNDLRAHFTDTQKLLNEAEESLTMLRAQLASQSGRGGKTSTGPTVEAVMRTIMKMTTMAEKRSGDIDVLENQMRKLRFNGSTGSREGSPYTTPAKASIRNSGTSSSYGLFYTPDSVKDSHHSLRNSVTSPSYSYRGTPPRKKLSGFTTDDKLRIKAASTRRNEIMTKLKEALRKSGSRVKSMDDD